VSHVEIASRVAMELGGGAPLDVDTTALLPKADASLSPLARVNDQVMRVCCIHEIFSGAIVTGSMKVARQPLLRAAEELIARDEAHHIRLGSLYFEWAEELLDDAERTRLADVAIATIERLAVLVRAPDRGAARKSYALDHIHALGWMDGKTYRARTKRALLDDVVPPLVKLGIPIDEAKVASLVDG
jgi:hypothetical protein